MNMKDCKKEGLMLKIPSDIMKEIEENDLDSISILKSVLGQFHDLYQARKGP